MKTLCYRLMLLFVGAAAAAEAHSACRFINGATTESLSPAITEIELDPSLPDRTQIGPEINIWANVATYMNCDASPTYTQNFEMLGAALPGSDGLYGTNIPGLAIAVAKSYNGVLTWYPFSQSYSLATNWTIEPASANAAYRIRFFKWGKVQHTGGTVAAGTVARYRVTWSGGELHISDIKLPAIVVKSQTCVVSDVAVAMGSFSASDPVWKGVGSRAPNVDFNLQVSKCPAGLTGVSFTLTPVTTLLSSPDWHITLDASSTAKGVGIQLRNASNDEILPICAACAPGTAGKLAFTYSSETGGVASFPMRANYLQTAAEITAGEANSSIIFTATYP